MSTKIKIIIFYCVAFSNNIFSQLAIIQDPNGYCNVRSSGEKADNIVDKLSNGHLVYCFESETTSNWLSIDYKNQKKSSVYVYKDKVKYLTAFTKIPILSKSALEVLLSKDSIVVVVKRAKLDKTKAKFTYQEGSDRLISEINGMYPYGTDGDIPKNIYQSIVITLGSQKIELPQAAFQDLFEPSLHNTKVTYDKNNDILYVFSNNSDGAGGYFVVWKIEKGVYKERFVGHGF